MFGKRVIYVWFTPKSGKKLEKNKQAILLQINK